MPGRRRIASPGTRLPRQHEETSPVFFPGARAAPHAGGPHETISTTHGGGFVLTRLENREVARRSRHLDPGRAALRPRPDLPPGTDLLPQIRHIVVLMMENHSYDNYLGLLTGRGDGFVLGPDGQPTAANPGDDGSDVGAHHFGSTGQVAHVPTQSWHASHLQWDKGRCDGFVCSVERTVSRATAADAKVPMGYWTERDLPFYYGLARTFPLADRWFSPCLGPTFPNRRFLIAGTAHGLIDDLPFGMVGYPAGGTVFDLLSAHSISWANYHHLSPIQIRWRRLSHAWGLNFFRVLGG